MARVDREERAKIMALLCWAENRTKSCAKNTHLGESGDLCLHPHNESATIHLSREIHLEGELVRDPCLVHRFEGVSRGCVLPRRGDIRVKFTARAKRVMDRDETPGCRFDSAVLCLVEETCESVFCAAAVVVEACGCCHGRDAFGCRCSSLFIGVIVIADVNGLDLLWSCERCVASARRFKEGT